MTLIYVPRSGMPTDPVVLPNQSFFSSGTSGNGFSGIRFGADGNLYRRQFNGGLSRFATWLFSGAASTYYLSRTINTGTLDTDAGAGPLQMNTNRDYDIQLAFTGVETCTVSFEISNDVSGSPVVVSNVYLFEIEWGNP